MKKIACIHITIIFCFFSLGIINKICKIELLNIFKILSVVYFFIGNFVYWILFKKIKGNLLITRATLGYENRLYYISSITNYFLYYAIIKVIFKINMNN